MIKHRDFCLQVAQLVEQSTVNRQVVGSSPTLQVFYTTKMINQKKLTTLLDIKDSNRKLFGVLLKASWKAGVLQLIKGKYILENEGGIIKMKTIWNLINYFNDIYCPNRMNFDHLSYFIQQYYKENQIDIVVILCPSYKKTGTVWLNEEIWQTTKKAIHNTTQLINKYRELCPECQVNTHFYYGDLSLEQYSLQPTEAREAQIQNNISQINNYIKDQWFTIKLKRMSEINILFETIWFSWVHDPQIIKNNIWLTKRIKERNTLFYEQILLRSKEKSETRSELCISSYAIMWKYFTETLKNPLMLYTANIYEKWVAYNFLWNRKSMFIIYLKKDNWSIISLYEQQETTT